MWYVEAPNDLRDAPHIYALAASPLEPRFKVTIDSRKAIVATTNFLNKWLLDVSSRNQIWTVLMIFVLPEVIFWDYLPFFQEGRAQNTVVRILVDLAAVHVM